jgi:beta-N-acetylhexosaminidase
MVKRFLISLALVLGVVVLAVVGASVLFSGVGETVEATSISSAPTTQVTTAQLQSTDTTVTTAEAVPQESDAPGETADPVQMVDPVQAMLDSMTLQEKICQLLFVTPEALTGYGQVTQSGTATMEALLRYPVGGVIYFSANLETVEQTQEMLGNIQSYSRTLTGRGLFLGVDEEGGTVARAASSLGTTAFQNMAAYGAAGDTQAVYDIGRTLAQDLGALGFNLDFAPVADVLTNEDNTVVRDRSFGSDPELVADMVRAEIQGLTEGGLLCAPKHFPGHGSTGGDTHAGFAATDRTLEELEECDLIPFQAAIEAGAPMIMVGHMTMTALDSEAPASLSRTIVTGLLREQLGYEGIIITDSLDMGAISDLYTPGEAVVQALAAGCDMALCVSDISGTLEAVTAALEAGTLQEADLNKSVYRVLSAKYDYGLLD